MTWLQPKSTLDILLLSTKNRTEIFEKSGGSLSPVAVVIASERNADEVLHV